jgi:hypothetical protein
MGLTAKDMPAPTRPFCFAGGPGLNAVRSIGRYTDLKFSSAEHPKTNRRYALGDLVRAGTSPAVPPRVWPK